MAKSKIERTEKTWNPLAGCTKVSPGCENCYAARMAHRLGENPNPSISKKYKGLAVKQANGKINWTGKIIIDRGALNKLSDKPSVYFVNSMSDLFHPSVEFSFIDSVYEVMGSHTQHIFQILTKHPGRAIEYYKWTDIFNVWQNWSHIWFGVSVENQKYADIRIPQLLQIPAKVRWLSCEPLLGAVDLAKYYAGINPEIGPALSMIDWVVVGGESGPRARIMDPTWVRGIQEQCQSFKVPFFFKQWGAYLHRDQMEKAGIKVGKYYNAKYVKGEKKELGRMFDGKIWDEYPRESER